MPIEKFINSLSFISVSFNKLVLLAADKLQTRPQTRSCQPFYLIVNIKTLVVGYVKIYNMWVEEFKAWSIKACVLKNNYESIELDIT